MDQGYQREDFASFLFDSSEFLVTTLRGLASESAPSVKEGLARNVADRLLEAEIQPAEVLRAYIRQPDYWLAFKLGRGDKKPRLAAASNLLFGFGDEGWYGPIPCQGEANWYLRVVAVPHYFEVGGRPMQGRIRWIVKAELGENYAALHWDGFSLLSDPKKNYRSQFHFWKYIPEIFTEFENLVGGQWHSPPLHTIVLKDLWKSFVANPLFEWTHLRVRAEAQGVVLNARSAGVADLDVGGLEALSSTIAKSAAEALPSEIDLSASDVALLEAAVLHTLIQEWGTNSYEFTLSDKQSGKKLFRAHCYFGLRPLLASQDAFQHLKCYSDFGASKGTLRFLLEHMP